MRKVKVLASLCQSAALLEPSLITSARSCMHSYEISFICCFGVTNIHFYTWCMHKVKALASLCQCAGSPEFSLIASPQSCIHSYEISLISCFGLTYIHFYTWCMHKVKALCAKAQARLSIHRYPLHKKACAALRWS